MIAPTRSQLTARLTPNGGSSAQMKSLASPESRSGTFSLSVTSVVSPAGGPAGSLGEYPYRLEPQARQLAWSTSCVVRRAPALCDQRARNSDPSAALPPSFDPLHFRWKGSVFLFLFSPKRKLACARLKSRT